MTLRKEIHHAAVATLLAGVAVSLAGGGAAAQTSAAGGAAQEGMKRMVTQGLAKTVIDNLFKCEVKVTNHRISAVGTITTTDGTTLTVPAETGYQKEKKLADLFNECNNTTPQRLGEVDLDKVPAVEIDADGEVVTGYIVADNYFEVYVNGKLVGVDAVPFTPFNSAIVRFKAKRPYTYALKLVDWEEKLGVGMEKMPDNDWHPGDGGVIARFSDGTVTDSTWKAQSFYIAPLASPDDVVEKGSVHDTTKLGRTHPLKNKPTCQEKCYAVHYPMPDNWAAAAFDDNRWPRAYEYTDEDVGVTTLTAYTRYPEAFEGARWIWTSNLVYDNVVLARKTVR
ncbi:MAG: hypothetical protein M3158_00210 [Pseudomonadota bacterium]|nr:hypothetical protein [Pseudomonadota bacterium]